MTVTTLRNEFIQILHIPAGGKDSICRSAGTSVVRVYGDEQKLITIYPAHEYSAEDLRAAFTQANNAVRISHFVPDYGGKLPLFGVSVNGNLLASYPLEQEAIAERDWKSAMVKHAETLLGRNNSNGPFFSAA